MPLRFLHYLSDVYRNMYSNDMLHRRSMLSDMFERPVDKPDIRTAVIKAIDECIEEGILVDFFEEHREEVVEVSIYDYDEEKTRKTLFEEAKELNTQEADVKHQPHMLHLEVDRKSTRLNSSHSV